MAKGCLIKLSETPGNVYSCDADQSPHDTQ